MTTDVFGRPTPKKVEDLEKLSRYSVDADRWDMRDFDLILTNQPDISVARQRLAENIAGEMGLDEAADVYWMLRKVDPKLQEDYDIRPSRLLNKRINEIVPELPDFGNVRRFTVGDPVASSQAFNVMEPDIEILYDRVQEEVKKQEQYEQALRDAIAAQEDERTAEEMLQEFLDSDESGDDVKQGELEAEVQAASERSEQAQQAARGALEDLEAAIEGMDGVIRATILEGLQKAAEYLTTITEMARAWGMEPGQLMRLPAAKRLDLAKRLGGPKWTRMAQLIGPAVREAFAAQKRKTMYTPAEIVDLTLGNDLPRLIPSEWSRFKHPKLKLMWKRDFLERHLVQYEMTDTEKIARGGIIYIHDGSLSMKGQREIWAKAIGLAFLHVARKQQRSFYGIQFGSGARRGRKAEIRIDDFRDTRTLDPDKVIDFAEYFFGGGTDFEAPLTHALKILEREHEEFGAIQSDIVFATDGSADISPEFMANFKAVQRRLDVTVWGICITAGGPNETRREPLNELCDGKVATISTLLNATDVKGIFGGV